MKIVLLGYMASGKSAIGKIIAKENNLYFVDLDNFIEEKEQLSISDIFAQKGEIYFRKKEGKYLNELLNFSENYIISLGGGTPCYGNNMEEILKKSHSFYLKASINTIFNRLKNETSQRPLVAELDEDQLKEYIAKHLFERRSFYEKATHSISVDNKNMNEISEEILRLI